MNENKKDMENLPTYRLTQSGPEAQEILDQVNLNTIDIEQLQRLYQALSQSDPEIIEPTDTWPVANPEENVIYRVIDRVNTPPESYSDYMWNGTSMVLMATYNNAIDNEPTANSNNLVKSGGVYSFVHANGGAYDISAAHAVGGVLATYDDLADALGTNGANVPAAVRKGGMSIKFVLTSDNKYVRFNYLLSSTANADIANVANWQGVDEEPTVGSNNLVKSKGVLKNVKVATFNGRGTYRFVGVLRRHTYRFTCKDSWDASQQSPGSKVLQIGYIDSQGEYVEVLSKTNVPDRDFAYNLSITDSIFHESIELFIWVFANNGEKPVWVIEDVTYSVEQRTLCEKMKITGDGANLVSVKHIPVMSGHKYRINLKNPNIPMTGVTGYSILTIPLFHEGSTTEVERLVEILTGNPLSKYYDVEIPSDANDYEIDIYMRAAVDAQQVFFIEDTTILDEHVAENNDKFDELDDDLIKIENKLAEVSGRNIDFDEGVSVGNSGIPEAEKDVNISPFIPISVGDVVTLHPGFSSDTTVVVRAYIYNAQKQYVDYYNINGYLPERIITISNSTFAYIRLLCKSNSIAFVKINGEKVWEYKPLIIGIKEYNLDKLGYRKPIYTEDNKYATWMAGYVHYDNGMQYSSSGNSCTGFIDVEGYESVEILMNVVNVVSDAGVCFYDSDGVFISGVKPNNGEESGYEKRIIGVPSGAKYIRASFRNNFLQYWELVGIVNQKVGLHPMLKMQKVTLEFGNLDSFGEIKPYASDFFDYARTSLYYKIDSINLPYLYTIYAYDSSYNFIGSTSANANTDYELDSNNWYKIVINYTANSLQKKEIVISLKVLDFSYNVITPKTIKTFQYLVKYKKGRGLYVDGDSNYNEGYNLQDDLISNTLRFYVPSNYSPKGEPVKLIYKAHGTNGYRWIDQTDWGGDNSIDYLADEGFALYDMFAGTSYYSDIFNPNLVHEYNTRLANYNIPIQLAAQVDAYEWITRNFNVEKEIYVIGKSHGGLAGIYATNKIVPTKAVALLAPLITQVADMYVPWGINLRSEVWMCLDDMCFNPPIGMTFEEMVDMVFSMSLGWKDCLLNNSKQQAGLIPFLNGITNEKFHTLLASLINDTYKVSGGMDNLIHHAYVPIKVWCAPDDDQVIFYNGLNWITSLQNGGSNAQFREFPSGSGGHSFDSFTEQDSIKDSVVTSLGVQYTAPRAYVEVINFLNQF